MADPTQATNALLIALVTSTAALLGAIAGAFIAPLTQHSLWRREQLAELRRNAISDLNRIASRYITEYMAAQERQERYLPAESLFAGLYEVDMHVRTLFSTQTHDVYKEWQTMLARNGPVRSVNEFVDAHEAALRAMYKEAGFI